MKNRATQPTDCWKTIGVWGQEHPRCSRLTEVIHCRNCEIFIQAGRNLLERELSTEYLNEWTEVMAIPKEEDSFNTLAVVIFRLGREWLALPAQLFAEIIPVAQTHRVPHRQNPVLMGVVNVHGEIQLCISLAKLLGIESTTEESESTLHYKRMMVVNHEDDRWVFPVNEIHGIHRLDLNRLQNVPVTVIKSDSPFTKGLFDWENKYVALLDDEFLLHKLTRSVQ